MIVYDLVCAADGHRFECWFASADAFAAQQSAGLVVCPDCGGCDVDRAVSAPRLARKGNQRGEARAAAPAPTPPANRSSQMTGQMTGQMTNLPPEAKAMLRAVAAVQAEALKTSTWVGEKFTDNARAMHYGEEAQAPIHGKATRAQAEQLAEEGIAVAPVIVPFVPPDELN